MLLVIQKIINISCNNNNNDDVKNASNNVVDYDLNEGLVTVGNVAQRVHLYLTVRHTTRSKLLLLLNSVTLRRSLLFAWAWILIRLTCSEVRQKYKGRRVVSIRLVRFFIFYRYGNLVLKW